MRYFAKSFWPLTAALFLVAACNAGLSPKPGEGGGGNNLGGGVDIVNLPQFPGAPPILTHKLIVNIVGFGKVETPDLVIECGAGFEKCAYDYNDRTVVVPSAPDTVDSFFVEWTGDCTGRDCTLTMNSDKTVTAHFEGRDIPRTNYTLTYGVAGSGNGAILNLTSGRGCDRSASDCIEYYAAGSVVQLAPIMGICTTFAWSGDCSPSSVYPACSVTMDDNKEAVATFSASPEYMVKIHMSGHGSGNVLASPVGVSSGEVCEYLCEGLCSGEMVCEKNICGGNIALSATVYSGSFFGGWYDGAGRLISSAAEYATTLLPNIEVFARFNLISEMSVTDAEPSLPPAPASSAMTPVFEEGRGLSIPPTKIPKIPVDEVHPLIRVPTR